MLMKANNQPDPSYYFCSTDTRERLKSESNDFGILKGREPGLYYGYVFTDILTRNYVLEFVSLFRAETIF
jgi:hypothetical protein